MIKENKTKTEITIAFSVFLFGSAIFIGIMEVMSNVLVRKDVSPDFYGKPFEYSTVNFEVEMMYIQLLFGIIILYGTYRLLKAMRKKTKEKKELYSLFL